ncbi:GntR family transcriptional regulator [Microlunatus sp. Gsoil 973]|uniref:GntR family transcriptional regulator n=1 Tax=Microlunatus sp. Gsoil 973 TaxID=2672569 RepID=UPI0012B4C2F7|nr:GntR family transcriptional regulator [Microlunatus sp. Gsoil 973]QGN31588.1 FCD domain-containing protein [Microlunatus sp. Gsoil 973]
MDAPTNMKPLATASYRQMVGEQLRAAIASGELAAGERLNEVAVAKQLGVSPTPVREAFRDLEQAGLIEVVPYRGARVRPLTERDLSEIYSLRAHLEQMGIRLAYSRLGESDFEELAGLIREMEQCARNDDPSGVVRHDVAFHRLIMARSDHSLLLKTWEQIHPSRWTYVTVRVLANRGPLYIAQRHWPLLEALRGPSPELAVDAAAKHIELVGDEAMQVLRGKPDEEKHDSDASEALGKH